jgi:hypothetical protein
MVGEEAMEAFKLWDIANRGISGDVSRHIPRDIGTCEVLSFLSKATTFTEKCMD